MTQEKKVQTAVVMNVSGVELGTSEAVRLAQKMADGLSREGARGGQGLEAMADGAEKAGRRIDAATKSISDQIRRRTREAQRELASIAATETGGSGSASAIEYAAGMRGADLSQLNRQLVGLREYESALSAVRATEREFAENAAFGKKAADAAKLVNAGEYVAWWGEALAKAEAAEREFQETAAFDKKAADAAKLVKAGEYVSWWAGALDRAEQAEREMVETQIFDRKAADAAKLVKAGDYVNWWAAQLDQMDANEKRAAQASDFVRGIEARTAALMKQTMALKLSEAQMAEWEAAQKNLSRDAAPAIEALRNQTAALEAARREASGKDFLSGLSAQTSALGKTRADLLEMKAAQLGVAESAAPMIKAIREADGDVDGMGRKSKELKWALRGLPAQFTDIWVSLVSGQSPMMVFIQQGGQLKDMFDGVGPAAQAMGRYVVGLVNPFTLAAAAAGVLFAAYKSGSDEITKLSQAVILSGERLGVTAGQMQDIAASVASLGNNTQGAASEFLALIAKDAKVSAAELERFTESALTMARVGGPAAAETAKAFSELGKDPLQASIKLTAQYNYLTKATFEQIQALEEQGKSTEAAAVAQRAFADLFQQRTPQMVEALGSIQRGWIGIKDAVASLWDTMKRVGREDTLAVQSQALSDQRAALTDALAKMRGNSGSEQRARAAIQAEISALDRRQAALQENIRLESRGAEMAKQRAVTAEALARLSKFDAETADKQAKQRKEEAEFQRDAIAAGKSRQYIEEGIAKIRAKYAEKPAGTGRAADPFAADRAAAEEWADFYLHFADAADKAEGKVAELTEAQVKLVQFLSAPAYQKMDEPARQLVLQEAYRKIAADQATAAQKEWAASVRESEREYNKLVEAMENSAESAEKQLAALEVENRARALAVASGLDLKDAIERVTIARLEERRVVLEAAGNDAAVEAIDREIEARKKLAVEARRASVYDAEKKRAEEIRKEYEKLSDSITDALMRGFENGKDFARNFRDTVVNMFRTMVLRPIVQAIVNPVAMALTGGLGASAGASAATNIVAQGGGADVAQSLQNLYGTLTGSFESVGTSVAMAADKMGEWLVMNTSGTLNKAGGTLMQYAGQIGAGAEIVAGATAGMGLRRAVGGQYEISKGYSTFQDVGIAVATAIGGPVLGAIAGATAGLVNRAFGRKPKEVTETGIEGQFVAGDAMGDSYSTWQRKGGWFRSTKRGTDRSAWDDDLSGALDAGAKAVLAQTTAWAAALELPADRLGELTSSFKIKFVDDAEANKKAIADAIAAYGETLASAYGDLLDPLKREGESLTDTLGRVSVLQTFSENLNQLGGVFSRVANLGIDVRESFIEMAGGMEALWQNAMGFAQNYYSRDEIAGLKAGEIQRALLDAGLSAAGDLTGRADFRALVESVDVSTDSGRQQLATLLNVQGAFVDVADYLAESGRTLAQAATQAPQTGVLTNLISPMQQQTDATLTLASGMSVLRSSIDRMIDVLKQGGIPGGSPAAAADPAPAFAAWPGEVYVVDPNGGA